MFCFPVCSVFGCQQFHPPARAVAIRTRGQRSLTIEVHRRRHHVTRIPPDRLYLSPSGKPASPSRRRGRTDGDSCSSIVRRSHPRLLRSADRVWRLGGVRRAGSPGSPRSIRTTAAGNGRCYLERERGKQRSVFFLGGTATAGTQGRRSQLSTIHDAGEKIRWSTPGQIAP